MPKFFSRVDFETMKVLRKRGSSIRDIAKAVDRSVGAISRNLKYKSYEDYLAAMYSHRSKFQKEVEAKSGPVIVTKPTSKKCSSCGELKEITEFTPDKNIKDGYKGQCRKCINAQRKAHRDAVKASAKQPSKNAEPSVETKLDWLFKLANEHDRRLKQIEAKPDEKPDEKSDSDEPVEEQTSEQGLEPRVGEVLNVFVDKKIRRAEIMGSREVAEFGYSEKRYLVRYKKFFGYKYADVSEAVLYTD
jgi:hypothetical protein